LATYDLRDVDDCKAEHLGKSLRRLADQPVRVGPGHEHEGSVMESDVVQKQFICGSCGTVFHCARHEPGCLMGPYAHPGQWHIHDIAFSVSPCEPCVGWAAPFMEVQANMDNAGSNMVLLYPPEPENASNVVDITDTPAIDDE